MLTVHPYASTSSVPAFLRFGPDPHQTTGLGPDLTQLTSPRYFA